ncbi:MAG: serine hydrolase [Pseudomonadota bacterium]
MRNLLLFSAIVLAACQTVPSTDREELAGSPGTQTAVAACDDPLLEQRRTNLPKTLPWPVDFFQPQAIVEGDYSGSDLAAPAGAVPEALGAAIERYAQTHGSEAVLLQVGGDPKLVWYGEETAPDTLHHTYHMHYSPLVMLIGAAVKDGYIRSVDQKASDFIAEWQGTDKADITIRDLLSMHAGLEIRRDAHYSEGMFSRDACAYWGSYTKDIIIDQYGPITGPGEEFAYNYIVPELLGTVLIRATGKRYEDYLSEALWEPLGNRDATVWLNRPDGEAHQDAALFASAEDWLRLGQLFLDDGVVEGERLLPEGWTSRMAGDVRTNPNFGWMWRGTPYQPARRLMADDRVTYTVAAGEPFLADDVVYFSGYGGQRVYVVPSRDLVLVHLGEVDRDFDNAELLNLVLEGMAP